MISTIAATWLAMIGAGFLATAFAERPARR